jgi:hypothetical protein
VRSAPSLGSDTRPLWLPPDQMRAVLVPSAAWGASGRACSPRWFSSVTVPLNDPGSGAARTELTRSSGATGGSWGWAPAPGAASSPHPIAPPATIPAATVRTLLRPDMAHSLAHPC